MNQSKGVRSTEVAFDILESIAFADGEIGVSAIASKLGLAKSAVFRHLQTLGNRGYILRDAATARYRLGIKLQLLANMTRGEDSLLAAAGAPMTDLRNAVSETVVLSAFESSGARVMATVQGNAMVEIGVRVGSLLPFESSAQGKILLAFGPQNLRNKHLQSRGKKGALPALQRELDRARRVGWLDSAGEVMPGVSALAAPIFDASDACAGAVAIVGLFPLSPRKHIQRHIVALLATTKQISRNLGKRHLPLTKTDQVTHAYFPRRSEGVVMP